MSPPKIIAKQTPKKREEEMRGEARAEYGAGVIKKLSKELTSIYGKGFEQ